MGLKKDFYIRLANAKFHLQLVDSSEPKFFKILSLSVKCDIIFIYSHNPS